MATTTVKPAAELRPIRDRRSSRRYVTWRNAGWLLVAGVGVLVVISLYGELRPRKNEGFGRLYEARTKETGSTPGRRIAEPIVEGKVFDQTASDPMLIQGTARERYLGVDGPPPPPPEVLTPETVSQPGDSTVNPGSNRPLLEQKGRIKISGNAQTGIEVEVQKP